MHRLTLRLAAFTLALCAPLAARAEDKPVSFKNDIAPILVRNCLACHGQSDPKGDYQLHTFAALSKAGESGEASVTAGRPADSYLLTLISSQDEAERMPKDADPMPADQVALVKRWISEGAKFDGPDKQAMLVTMVPRRAQPKAPEKYRAVLPVTAVAFNNDGKELAVGGYHEITIWNVADGKLLRRIHDVEERVYGMAYLPGSTVVAAATGTPGQTGEVSLYDTTDGRRVRTLTTTAEVMFCVAVSPDGKKLACGGADRAIRTFDLTTGKPLKVLEDHADWVQAVAWNKEANRLASGSRDKSAKWLDADKGEALLVYSTHADVVYGVAVSADSKLVYSGGGDRKIHAWSTDDAKQAALFAGFGGEVFKVLLHEKQLFGCSADKTIRMFDTGDAKKAPRVFSGHTDHVYTIDFHPGTKKLASGSYDGEVRIWNAEDGKQLVKFVASPGK
ncbi:MAG: hypothetical protein JSS27_06075 [Planctomycetes bacterium]|nr:hypothetical protein [Planctomycetota bacterium]